MTSKVYFIDMRATIKENFIAKIGRLMETAGISTVLQKRDLTAVKIHFGEMGNAAFIRPVYIRKVVEMVKQAGAIPFLTDANTLYAGTRSDAPHHLTTAIANGFAYAVVEAPLIIADGLRGKNETMVEINQKRYASVYIGTDIVEADALVSVAHFKGHELSGFGGTIKNVGMGCASRKGKLAQHSGLSPKISGEQCIGCGECREHCSQHAISMTDEKAVKSTPRPVSAAASVSSSAPMKPLRCSGVVHPGFSGKHGGIYHGGAQRKGQQSLFHQFHHRCIPGMRLLPGQRRPHREKYRCCGLHRPRGHRPGLGGPGERGAGPGRHPAVHEHRSGEDKFKGIYPKVDWEVQLDYAERLGLGMRAYELVGL
jgi:uncharacterized Fe-S center protein